jgi:hypothetical protein
MNNIYLTKEERLKNMINLLLETEDIYKKDKNPNYDKKFNYMIDIRYFTSVINTLGKSKDIDFDDEIFCDVCEYTCNKKTAGICCDKIIHYSCM